jgi:hypothetical protein
MRSGPEPIAQNLSKKALPEARRNLYRLFACFEYRACHPISKTWLIRVRWCLSAKVLDRLSNSD